MNLRNLSIFPATLAQAIESRKRSYEQWGKAMEVPFELYIDEEDTMNGLEMASEGRRTTWILAPRDDPQTMDFMCSCETFRREAIVFTKSKSKPEHKTGYGIASVYTPPRNRGKGYARHMMHLLHWVLAPSESLGSAFPAEWGAPPSVPPGFGSGVVSVLYSDIGEQFYKACGPAPGVDGWSLAPHVLTTWDLSTILKSAGQEAQGENGWTLLASPDVDEVVTRDSELIIEETSRAGFTFLPRKGLVDYQQKRAEWFMDEALKCYWGAESDTKAQDRPLALWTFEFLPQAPKTLLITRLRCPKERLATLIMQAAKYAKDFDVERIQVWNMPEELRQEAEKMGGESVPADEHLACMKWYGDGESTVEWLHNEKFAWC